jgi:hypothetical protein
MRHFEYKYSDSHMVFRDSACEVRSIKGSRVYNLELNTIVYMTENFVVLKWLEAGEYYYPTSFFVAARGGP